MCTGWNDILKEKCLNTTSVCELIKCEMINYMVFMLVDMIVFGLQKMFPNHWWKKDEDEHSLFLKHIAILIQSSDRRYSQKSWSSPTSKMAWCPSEQTC